MTKFTMGTSTHQPLWLLSWMRRIFTARVGRKAPKRYNSKKTILLSKEGGVLRNIKDGKMSLGNTYFVKKTNQIKSVTDNNGLFSTENDDIQMAIMGIDHYQNTEYLDQISELQNS